MQERKKQRTEKEVEDLTYHGEDVTLYNHATVGTEMITNKDPLWSCHHPHCPWRCQQSPSRFLEVYLFVCVSFFAIYIFVIVLYTNIVCVYVCV